MKYDGIILEKDGPIATITLNRPEKLNALTKEMLDEELPSVINEVKTDDEIKAVIITGTGRGFCSGADVSYLAKRTETRQADPRWAKLQPLGSFALNFRKLEKPIIGAINGVAAGGGVSLALLCDIRIASENARFSITFVKRGLIPDLGTTYNLTRLIGTSRALELMLLGEYIDAQEAYRVGLVSKVVALDQLMPAAKELAKRLASGASVAQALIKRLAYQAENNNLEEQLYWESYAQNLCFTTEDCKEGVYSFLQKREPVFKGK